MKPNPVGGCYFSRGGVEWMLEKQPQNSKSPLKASRLFES